VVAIRGSRGTEERKSGVEEYRRVAKNDLAALQRLSRYQ
jgi:hypothetical protein